MSCQRDSPVKNDEHLLLYLGPKSFSYTSRGPMFIRHYCAPNSPIIVTSVASHFSAAIYLPDKSVDAALINVPRARWWQHAYGCYSRLKGKLSLKTRSWKRKKEIIMTCSYKWDFDHYCDVSALPLCHCWSVSPISGLVFTPFNGKR